MSERHRVAALKRGVARASKVLQSVDQAMQMVANEMEANGGIYPHNGGAVSIAEIARRASINESTFYKKDNAALKERVTLWLNTLKKKETVGRMRVRMSLQQRAESWKEKYAALQNRHIRTELELQQLQAEHEKLRRDYEVLLEQVRHTNISNIKAFPKARR